MTIPRSRPTGLQLAPQPPALPLASLAPRIARRWPPPERTPARHWQHRQEAVISWLSCNPSVPSEQYHEVVAASETRPQLQVTLMLTLDEPAQNHDAGKRTAAGNSPAAVALRSRRSDVRRRSSRSSRHR